jgi:urease accessory protein
LGTTPISARAKFLYCDIFCPGRVARGEFWDFEIYSSKVVIEEDKKLILNESTIFTRQDKDSLDVIFGDNKFYLKAYWYSENAVRTKKEIDFGNTYGGATQMASNIGLIIKALSNALNDLQQLQGEIWKIFRKTETGMEVPSLRMY